jgi:hypothetical protein
LETRVALERHDELARAAFEASGGVVFKRHCCIGTERDSERSKQRLVAPRIVTKYNKKTLLLRLSGGSNALRDWPFRQQQCPFEAV